MHNKTWNKDRTPQLEQQSTTNQQQNNRRPRADSILSHWEGGLNAFYWYQIFALDSVDIKAQTLLSSHGGFLAIAIYQHRETIESY